ncbi:MAG: flagellar basal body P-ring formation chaperone FlgA, partial [Psychromonas sp.]|nr:flagellar basal body P-ring formation chaperone FlgA [Psychromonas sp.]
KEEIQNFAKSLISAKYETTHKQKNNEKLQIKVSPLDKRLTFSPCSTNLTGEVIGNKLKKNTSVKISCPAADGWTTYIHARVLILVPSIVTSRALSKGQTLNVTNMKLIYINKSLIRNGSFSKLAPLLGARLKRNLSENKIIKDRDICIVCRNDKVIINASKNGLSIKTSGIAQNDANIGRTVRVKNSRTQRIIVGTVSALKEVQVSF